MTSATETNVRRLREQIDAYNRHDIDDWLSFYADGAVAVDHALGQSLVTRDEIRGYMQTQLTAFPDDRVEDVEILAVDDWTVTRFVSRGTHDGPWAGLEPTHQFVETDLCNVTRWVDGEVVEDHIYYDLYRGLAQLGQVPPLTATA